MSTVIAAAARTSSPPTGARSPPEEGGSGQRRALLKRPKRVSYGATSNVPSLHVQIASPEPSAFEREDPEQGYIVMAEDGDGNGYAYDDEDTLEDLDLGMAWKWKNRYYIFIPVATFLFFGLLVAIITWGWPPSKAEREEGQSYPHPFFWRAFLVGVFASFTVQSLRVPLFIFASWLPGSGAWTGVLSSITHVIVHEACRMVSVPLTIPSPTSGFHSSYCLGLGWGVAEALWGIVQGYEQLSLYSDLSYDPCDEGDCEECIIDEAEDGGLSTVPEEGLFDPEDEAGAFDDMVELEHRVNILERMRARQALTPDLEDIMGIPFPLIPFPLHILWRVDTLLLNLGLTLILFGVYFDSEPIYKHEDGLGVVTAMAGGLGSKPPIAPKPTPSKWLPLVWAAVTLVHIALALMWKVVGRVGVGAVTWGGMIVALGSVFAGLGVWGGVV